MSPALRKILYAVSFETLGVAVASIGLLLMSEASAEQSITLSILAASLALGWSFVFNSLFERWEARQSVKGRSWRRRAAHGLGFEGGLALLLVAAVADMRRRRAA